MERSEDTSQVDRVAPASLARSNQPQAATSSQNQKGKSSDTDDLTQKSKAVPVPGVGGRIQTQPKPKRPNPAAFHAGPRSFARFIKPARRLSQELLDGEPNIKGIARLMELFGVEQVRQKAEEARQLFEGGETAAATTSSSGLPQAGSAGSAVQAIVTAPSGLESDQAANLAAPATTTLHFTEGGKARNLGGVFFALMREYARSQ